MFRDYVSPATKEWWRLVKTWPDMPKKPCSARIAYCRNLNIAMCIAQALAAFFSVFRWLHFGNVNGLRYLGYAFTCSLMQAELVVLLAPYVPFYKTNVVFVVLFTHAFLICGWVGSLHDGFLFEDASWELFLSTWEPSSLVVTTKGIIIGITASCLGFLCLIQMPFLVLTYFCAGGCRPHQDLPYHYLRCTVWFTWPAFPCWWLISAEGLGLLGDAKSNAVGFAILNMISKGGFTLAMLKMGADHRVRWPDTSGQQRQSSWIVDQLQSYERNESQGGNGKVGKQRAGNEEETAEQKAAEQKAAEPKAQIQTVTETLWV
ncbi:unnamed protein product [Symbiodinium pilosum]|uniref:Uncharacterized protein n=1 Tax=Symbiodinium pilosum TaxID=2952 RepID=A0A812K756_SYMPI|nr:unnamed protein product [Symbiodinium pilosum]